MLGFGDALTRAANLLAPHRKKSTGPTPFPAPDSYPSTDLDVRRQPRWWSTLSGRLGTPTSESERAQLPADGPTSMDSETR
jgi:hypothetical protein